MSGRPSDGRPATREVVDGLVLPRFPERAGPDGCEGFGSIQDAEIGGGGQEWFHWTLDNPRPLPSCEDADRASTHRLGTETGGHDLQPIAQCRAGGRAAV